MTGVVQGLLVAVGLLFLSPPADAGTNRGGSSVSSRSSSGGGHSSSAGSRSSSGSSRSGSVSSRSSSGGSRTVSASPRSSSGGRTTTGSTSTRGSYGDRGYASQGSRSASGTRTYSGTGTRGGYGGHPGGGSGGYPGGGHHGGGHHGFYCPPTFYAGSSWYWGGPWDWWWGWGPYWGMGPYWGWGGVYVINEVSPYADQYARVDTDVSPETAEVYLDGTLIGQADDFDGFPDYLYLETGKYRLEFRHPSYEPVTKEIEVRAGQTVAMKDELKLLPGIKKLQVVDPEDKGTPLGRVFGKPEAQRTAEDRTGRFDVKAEPDQGENPDGDVRAPVPPPLPAGPDVAEVPPSERSRLRFEIEPDDAAVYLDDRYIGTAEELGGLRRGFPVRAGKHTVTVVRPGHKARTIDLEVKAGVAIDVVIELEK